MASGEIEIYGPLRAKTGEGKVAFASQIYDEEQGKFQSEINQEGGGGSEDAVLYTPQTLTNNQKTQARNNIGAASTDSTYTKSETQQIVQDIYDNVNRELGNKQDVLESGVNVKTINNQSILGNGNIEIGGGGGSTDAVLFTPQTLTDEQKGQARSNIGAGDEVQSNKVTSWQSTPDDIHYPSEKLVKDSIDNVDNVFIAEPNVTTYQEIANAIESGKAVFCWYDSSKVCLLSLRFYSARKITFCGIDDANRLPYLTLKPNNVWSADFFCPEYSSNKKTIIVGNETSNGYYPTTKAVADYVSNAKKEVEDSIDGKYKSLTPVENDEGHFVITPLGINYIEESLNTAYIIIDEGSNEKQYGSVYEPDMGWLYTVIFKTGSTPNITFEFSQVSTDETIVYPDDFSIEANRLYELSIMYIGLDVITNVKTYLLRIVDYTIPEITNGGSNGGSND